MIVIELVCSPKPRSTLWVMSRDSRPRLLSESLLDECDLLALADDAYISDTSPPACCRLARSEYSDKKGQKFETVLREETKTGAADEKKAVAQWDRTNSETRQDRTSPMQDEGRDKKVQQNRTRECEDKEGRSKKRQSLAPTSTRIEALSFKTQRSAEVRNQIDEVEAVSDAPRKKSHVDGACRQKWPKASTKRRKHERGRRRGVLALPTGSQFDELVRRGGIDEILR